jgi:DNA-binding MarR family transcriptional regulator
MASAEEIGRESAERNIGYLMHDAARLMRVNYDRRMRDLKLTRSQWWVLNHVYFNEGIIQTELSAILEIERATLGRLLDRLEEKGWIERRPDPNDRRAKRVFLTREVDDLVHTMRERARELREQALSGFSQQDQELLIDMLIRMKKNLSPGTEEEKYGEGSAT